MEGARLRQLRERALLTQAELAAKAGMNVVSITRLETGARKARFSTIRKLASALGVEPTELVKKSE